jgi:predicted membrane protein DUF2238
MTRERLRHLLFGDWSRYVRDPIDLIRLSFLGATVYLLATGDYEDAVRMGLTFVLLAIVHFLDLPRPVDLGFCCGMLLQGWGNVYGAFHGIDHYDKVVHFVLPFFVAPSIYILLGRLGLVPDLSDDHRRHHQLAVLIATFAFGLAVGAIYEMYEWFDVNVLGGHLHVGYGDTIADLGDDAISSLGGGLLLVWWSERGWGTSRRLPERRIPD